MKSPHLSIYQKGSVTKRPRIKDERDNDTVDIKFKDSHGGTEKNMYSAMFPYSGSGQTNGKYLAKEYKHPSTPTVTDDRAKPQFAAIVTNRWFNSRHIGKVQRRPTT